MKNVTKHIYYANRISKKNSYVRSNHHIYNMSKHFKETYIHLIKILYEK